MRTLVISDLHLGAHRRRDLLRRPALREVLLERLAGADELVVLGDVLELREVGLEDGLEILRPFLEDVGEAMGHGRVVLVPGNHDHLLARPVLDGIPSARLGLEHVVGPHLGSPLARVARRMGSTELRLAYPGLWVRPDVYATHGHYLDLHNSVPTLEILGLALSARRRGGPPAPGARPGEYEDALRGPYDRLCAAGRAASPTRVEAGADLSLRTWQRLNSPDGSLGARLLTRVAFPAAVGAANRMGLGPFGTDVSGPGLRRASLRAMGEVARRLGIEAEWVLFGHTHRSGPWPERDAVAEWTLEGGTRLVNTGSWVYQPGFLPERLARTPYWPGTVVEIAGGGPPVLRSLLAHAGEAELHPWS